MRIHKQRMFIIVSGAIGVVAAFLPWVTVSIFGFSASVSGTKGTDGWIFLGICAVASIFAATVGDRLDELPNMIKKTVAALGFAALFLVVYELYYIFSEDSLSVGLGLWVSLIAPIGIIASPFVVKEDGDLEVPTADTINADLEEE